MSSDYYKVLDVAENATAKEIKSAFRRLAKKFHPDRNRGNKDAENRFKELSEAYETLGDSQKKSQYDTMRKYGAFAGRGGQPGQQGFNDEGMDFSQFFRQGGGGRGGFQTFRSGGLDGLNGFEEIISKMFGGGQNPFTQGGGRQRGQPMKGQNISTELTISFKESVTGVGRRIQLENSSRKLNVKIPAGIESGGKIRLAGQGMAGAGGGPNGDLIITVNVKADQQFRREGNNIHTTVEVPFTKAILGGKVPVTTLAKKVSLTLPPGTQPGTVMRLKGLGLSLANAKGDMLVEVKVTLPEKLTDDQRKIIEGWEE